ncbi:MAG: hypothetical protein KDC38_09680 [Planctomycetes bacterium]|nr:hypothetical protein [Planctomycetota bacterium]
MRTTLRITFLALCLAPGWTGSIARGQADTESRLDGRTATAEQRWREMPKQHRERIRRLARTIRQLPAQRRAELFRQLKEIRPAEAEKLARRVERFRDRPLAERRALHRRAEHFRLLESRLSSTEREALRQAEPTQRRQLLRQHLQRLQQEFQRSMNAGDWAALQRRPERVRRSAFAGFLERVPSTPPEIPPGRAPWLEFREQLRDLPPGVRRRLLRDPERRWEEVPEVVQDRVRHMSPRQRQRLERSFFPRSRD